MRNRFILSTSAVGIALALSSLSPIPMAAQVTKAAAKSAVPRTPDGHPDLQGTYDLGMMTPLERLPGDPPFLTKEKAEALEKAIGLAVGQAAPDFLASDQFGHRQSLAALKGKTGTVLLFFRSAD